MDVHSPDAERTAAVGGPDADLTAGVEPTVEQPERNSPASAVCYMNINEAQEPPSHSTAPAITTAGEHTPSEGRDVGVAGAGPSTEDGSNTPRSQVPPVVDTNAADSQQLRGLEPEPGFFSPRPLRPYGSELPSTEPLPTTSSNASTPLVNMPEHRPTESNEAPNTATEQQDRPSVQRDASTASVATIRPRSVDPTQTYTPPSRLQRDGPRYPNQSYEALQFQHYPPPHPPPIARTRTTHPAHCSSHSAAHITTFGLPPEHHHHHNTEFGSRTVGNSPANSPGLFSPTTPPLHHHQRSDDGYYSSPYLHYTQRQAPKETHVADVDVDPISGRKIINQYEVQDELGRGVHGKVKLGRNLETGENVAIKIVDRYSKRRRLGKSTSHEDKIKREIAILKKARHPNIVSLLEVIDDPSRKKVYIVLEFVELGEVKWRTPGEKEVVLIEWRRYQRESQGIFESESAAIEDEQIINLAHQKLEREQRRRARLMHMRRLKATDNEAWSFEHGGDSDDEDFGGSQGSRASPRRDEWTRHQHRPTERREDGHGYHESNMETAVRSTTPTATSRQADSGPATGLEGTMYGAYDTEPVRGRTPSVAESSSSHFTDEDDEVPEHFRWVPTMTLQGARETFRDTVLGLEYLHYQNVIHRDIKPANLLQTNQHRIKISDFGVSYLGRQPSEELAGDQSESDFPDADEAIELAKTVGTPAFYAPELCRTDVDGETPTVDGKIDVWALGVTLYCLIYGRVPFHDYNTFALMKMITDTEVHIPQYRLKAVSQQSSSRPTSHGRLYPSMTTSRRAPHDVEYEEVDDILRDLLKRLLIKDSKKRISIKEIKRHPWLLHGLDNFGSWVEETDPGRSSEGRKIEVSKDELEKAVVPLTIIDRVRSGVRKTLDTVLGMGRRGGSRRRAQSNTTNVDQPPLISAHSSSSTISQEGRRGSLGLNQSIFEALSRSRESEHPLSQSVTASPEATERANFFAGPNSRTGSPAYSVESNEYLAPLSISSRPPAPERAHSTMSSAASVRTIRPSDLTRSGGPVSPGIPPALPGTPTALDTPGGSNLGGIFGGVPRRLVNSVRSRERMLKPPQEHSRAKSIDRLVGTDDDAHSGPSIALSTTFASGHVDQPDLLKDLSPTLARGPSPSLSDIHAPDPMERAASRQSSVSSASSYANRVYAAQNQLEVGPTQEATPYMNPSYQRETSDERYSRAKDDFMRRRVMEANQPREGPLSATIQRPTSPLSQSQCPPSPDDEVFFQRKKVEDYLNRGQGASFDSNPIGYQLGLISSSSEDYFTSMSQSTSNPSIPSVVSANSSVAHEDSLKMVPPSRFAAAPSGDSLNQFDAPIDDHAGYDGDGDGNHPFHSDDEFDDESDEDDFIVMGKKPAPKSVRSGSISNAELARKDIHTQYLSERRRSTRSGSNGTVKKITPVSQSDDERQN